MSTRKEKPTIAEAEGFPIYCTLQGFDLAGFDRWLGNLEQCDARTRLIEQRQLAVQAMLGNREDAALKHLELMYFNWRFIARVDQLLPMAKQGKNSGEAQANRRKGTGSDHDAVRRYHARLVKSGDHNATSLTGTAFGIGTRQVRNILKPPSPKRK